MRTLAFGANLVQTVLPATTFEPELSDLAEPKRPAFLDYREQRGLSIRRVSEKTGVSRKAFAARTKHRVDDIDVRKIILDRRLLYKLIVINEQLRRGEIDKKTALREIRPITGPFERRKRR